MIKLRPILTFIFLAAALSAFAAEAENESEWEIKAQTPDGRFDYDEHTGNLTSTNGIVIRYAGVVLMADQASANQKTGEVEAHGRVRIQRDNQVWAGDHIRYNFKTREMATDQFRMGRTPVFAEGRELRGNSTNSIYTAHSAYVTTDDVDQPFTKIRANRIKIVPGKYIQAENAVLIVGGVPMFYFPYYKRNISERANNWSFVPGYRSKFGPYLLSTYQWFWDEPVDGALHFDYRGRRGPGVGPDVNLHLGRWGEAEFKYYYTYDGNPDERDGITPPHNRQLVSALYDAAPFTNFTAKAAVRYQTDPLMRHDFFESDYRRNPQPSTFVELNQLWSNFSLDAYAQPRVNDFYETVERLPDLKLTGFRQQLGNTPLFYESESSAGWYRREFAELTNSFPRTNNFSAARADTYHQITLPHTFLGWLNVAPRAGGRFTYYSEANGRGATTDEEYRGIFNTGAEVNFKVSRLWQQTHSKALDLDGLRHIIEPSVNYVYVPEPHPGPPKLPQFDYELPSLRLLPIEFPDYNAIDSIDTQNVFRFGLRNRLQTKRDGVVDTLLNWNVYTDWRLHPNTNQTTFADLYSDLLFRPRTWLTLDSQVRYDIDTGHFRLSYHTLTIAPNETWSWALGHL